MEIKAVVVFVMTKPEMVKYAQQMVVANIGAFPPGAHEWRWEGDELWLKVVTPYGEVDGKFDVTYKGYVVVAGEVK